MGLSCHTQPLFTAGELAPDMTSGFYTHCSHVASTFAMMIIWKASPRFPVINNIIMTWQELMLSSSFSQSPVRITSSLLWYISLLSVSWNMISSEIKIGDIIITAVTDQEHWPLLCLAVGRLLLVPELILGNISLTSQLPSSTRLLVLHGLLQVLDFHSTHCNSVKTVDLDCYHNTNVTESNSHNKQSNRADTEEQVSCHNSPGSLYHLSHHTKYTGYWIPIHTWY